MERGREMDVAGAASTRSSLIPTFLIFLLLRLRGAGQRSDAFLQHRLVDRARQLFAEQRWQDIVNLGESEQNPSAEFDFYYGTALAQLGRWTEAQQVFAAGARLQPGDKRFPLELAGVAFKQKQYAHAARYLRRALQPRSQ